MACQLEIRSSSRYQEAGLHCLEHATLHISSCHSALVHIRQTVAHSHCLFQPVAPAEGALLQRLKATLVDWQDAMQFSLHHSISNSVQSHKRQIPELAKAFQQTYVIITERLVGLCQQALQHQ